MSTEENAARCVPVRRENEEIETRQCQLAAARNHGTVTISPLASLAPSDGWPQPAIASSLPAAVICDRRTRAGRSRRRRRRSCGCCRRRMTRPPAWRPLYPLRPAGYLLALVCLLVALVRARRRLLPAVVAVAVMALTSCHLMWLAPVFVADQRAPGTAQFRLMTLNMDDGERTPATIEQAARADIVILVETTPAARTPWATRLGPALSVLMG